MVRGHEAVCAAAAAAAAAAAQSKHLARGKSNLKVAVCSRLPSTADRVFSPQIPHPFAAHAHESCASEK